MERVLLNKVQWLTAHGHEVVVVTTDQKGRAPFYAFPPEVRMVDLDVNYTDDNHKHALLKIAGYLRRRRLHKARLTALLKEEKADVVVSLFPSESSFIPDIKDGSRKVLELHFNKFFRLQYNRTGLMGLIDRVRTRQDERLVRRFDRFVVLTHEDKGYWGDMPNICVIPNAAKTLVNEQSDCKAKRVIAVGRLDYQKGFDRLIEAWEMVCQHSDLKEWHLDIFGQGEWRSMLQGMIDNKNLAERVTLHEPTKDISKEYAASSFLAMSSHYEGFPMVMIEAMACGLPVVTFDYLCGPRDIIHHKENGLLVPNNDIKALADAMIWMMRNDSARQAMGREACKVTDTYSEEVVMEMFSRLALSEGSRSEQESGGAAG